MGQGKIKYVAVREALVERLREASPGDRLPSESELCAEYKVSRITIRRAVEDLMQEGLLVREQGRGTFVTDPAAHSKFRESFADRVTGFYRQQTAAGRTVTTRVTGNTVVRDEAAATELGVNPGSDLIRLDRIRYVNGTLQQFSTTWLEAARFPRLLAHDFTTGSLYEFLEATYGTYLARNDLLVHLSRAEGEVAQALGLHVGEPILAMASTVFESDDDAVAFGLTSFTPRNSEISIVLRDIGSRGSPRVAAQVSETIMGPDSRLATAT